jgi:Tfp pilus assembly protein PilO
MNELLQRAEPRTLGLAMVATVALTLAASFLYVLKRPWLEYGRLQQTRTLLEAEVADEVERSGEIARLTTAVDGLEQQLLRGSQAVPVNQMVAHIIDQLDRISGHHEVQLQGVTPGTSKPVFMFEEVPFEIELTGKYLDLYDWLREVEQELGPMVVKNYEVRPERDGEARMKLTVVSYRTKDGGS